MIQSLPTKRARAKETEAYHEIVDNVIDLDLTSIRFDLDQSSNDRGAKSRGGEEAA
jgi:hypothetical protein